jgi:restriction system protein
MPAVPTYDKLMWPTLRALRSIGGSATIEELLSKVIELEDIPPDVQAVPHTQRETKLAYNLAWARTYLKKVGAIDNSSRDIWSITKDGESFTEADVRLVPARVRKLFDENGVAGTDAKAYAFASGEINML